MDRLVDMTDKEREELKKIFDVDIISRLEVTDATIDGPAWTNVDIRIEAHRKKKE